MRSGHARSRDLERDRPKAGAAANCDFGARPVGRFTAYKDGLVAAAILLPA